MTGTTAGFNDAARLQESLLAPLERRVLAWLARHTPSRIGPDHLTLLGFAGWLLAGLCYAGARWWPASLLLVNVWIAINWLGDSLDGTLARFRNKLRPRYGFYVDHIIDTFGALFVMGGLGLSGYISPLVALALLVSFFMLAINTYLATYTIGKFELSFWKFGPTELRILLAIGNLVALVRPRVSLFGARYLFFDVGGVIGAVSMTVLLIVWVVRNTRTLYNAERV